VRIRTLALAGVDREKLRGRRAKSAAAH